MDAKQRHEQLTRLLEAALELPHDEREAFLADACQGDSELYREAQELLEMDAGLANPLPLSLEGHGQRLRDLVGSTDAQGDFGFSEELLERLSKREGSFGRYVLKGEFARGGQGVILRAWDEDLRRDLAMKVIQGRLGGSGDSKQVDPATLARFLEEAQVTGQLDHPGIVPVHELGVDPEGRVYFTMKLVRAVTLAVVFRELARGEGGWTQTRVLGLLLKVCEAMSFSHAKGVIHRDLKPANVMVGSFGEVFVMDWGLAKVLGREDKKDIRVRAGQLAATDGVRSERQDRADEGSDSPLYTMDGDVVGTPAYMSPEQAAGMLDEMGPHSDVYAIGAMLYHLIAGHPPHVPPGRRGTNYAIWRWVQDGPPRPLHELSPDTPAELVAICEKSMARSIEERYSDTAALAQDLSAYIEGRVVHAYEAGAWAETRKWVRRNKLLAGSLVAAAVFLVLGASSVAYVQAQGKQAAKAQQKIAEDNAKRADDQAAIAKQQERLAKERAEDVFRLSALQDLEDLLAEANTLWPPNPENIQPYRDWIREAQGLMSELPRHGAKRDELRELALPPTGERQDWGFPEEYSQERWWNEQLTKLIGGLKSLEAGLLSIDAVTPEHGWSVAKRLAFAEDQRGGFAATGPHAVAWERVLPAIRAAYPGLDLAPQIGLLPIGPDPLSGLWEFAHLMTGTPAERGSDGKLVLTEQTGVVLVLLSGGTFWMGAQKGDPAGRNYDPRAKKGEGPVHEVVLSAFFLSKYELTQGQWVRLTGYNPSGYQKSDLAPTLLHPVELVNWLECEVTLKRAGLQLPSEAQWEYGARAGTHTPWWTGAERESLWKQGAANLADLTALRPPPSTPIEDWLELDDGYLVHAPVGTFAANPFGLHEVLGNVWEWCCDAYKGDFYSHSPLKDPVAQGEGKAPRAYRGGGFHNGGLNSRSANRRGSPPSFAIPMQGVRPARGIAR